MSTSAAIVELVFEFVIFSLVCEAVSTFKTLFSIRVKTISLSFFLLKLKKKYK